MQNLIDIDQSVFSWFNSLVGVSPILDWKLKFFAVYLIYLVPVLLLFFWFYPTSPRLRGAREKNEKTQLFLLNLLITSVISWQVIARIIGEWINRPRPDTFLGTKELLFHTPTYAFPSDHALFLAFITTFLFLGGYKKMGWIALIATIIISLSRVIIGFHWPLDVLVGWIIGIILAYLFYQLRNLIEKYLSKPLL